MMYGVLSVIFIACLWLAFELGRKKEKVCQYEEKENCILEVRKARSSLNDTDVVDELHDKYTR